VCCDSGAGRLARRHGRARHPPVLRTGFLHRRKHGGTLPEHADAPGYRIESHTATHDEATFRRLAHELREHCTTGTGWLGGTFPGDDAALTVLAAEPDGTGWRWQTWHLYPAASGGTVVHTASRWHHEPQRPQEAQRADEP